jgi:hypothetical protein
MASGDDLTALLADRKQPGGERLGEALEAKRVGSVVQLKRDSRR